MTIHDVYAFEPDQRVPGDYPTALRLAMWKKAARRATVVLTVSEFSKARICEILGVPNNRVKVVGNGVEQVFFDIARHDPDRVSPLPGEHYFLSIGGITRKKGGWNTLKFASLLDHTNRNLRLVVLGPVDREFRAKIPNYRSLVVLDRGLKDAEVARWMRGAVAVLLFSEYEGFGIPALEAMAAGVPVIGNRKAALPEIIGEGGLLINASASTDLETVIKQSFDPNFRKDLIRRGMDWAVRWRWERCVDKLIELLRQPNCHR